MKLSDTLFCLLFAISANLFSTAKAQAVDVNDSLALVDFYNSTNGPNWDINTNWLTTKPVSTWYGIIVTGIRVTTISFYSNSLKGPIPVSIGNLTGLKTLRIASDGLTGSIPSSIGNLANLNFLLLSFNALSGSIPSSIGNLANLKELELYGNQLSGNIPPSITNLTNLTTFYLNYNQLSGSIPADIGKLKNLITLHTEHNQLTGSIPASVSHIQKLQALYLNDNQLTGGIPMSFKNLTYLEYIYLDENQLSEDNNPHFPNFDKPFKGASISFNRFTFNGLEFVARQIPNCLYAKQAHIAIHQHGNTLSVSAGGTLSRNTYRWFKVGTDGKTIIKGDSTFTPTESGKYYAKIFNGIATQLTLITDTIDFTFNNLTATNRLAIDANSNKVKQALQVFPNPASSTVNVRVSGTATILVTNDAGKVMLSKNITNSASVNVSSFANGIYYIQNKTTCEVQKIVVSH